MDLFGDEQDKKITIKREATAMSTKAPSGPTIWAYRKGYIKPVIFDWGCGRGRDSNWLRSQDLEVISYDPFYKPDNKPDHIDFTPVQTILLNYVLNVIEDEPERSELLKKISNVANKNTLIIVSCRSKAEIDKQSQSPLWKKYNDGFVTSRNTFQKGFTLSELTNLCSQFGKVIDSVELGNAGVVVCLQVVTSV
jgi:DNA phosphorothioation-associated putative methyltransferase